jgi:hypothetical protein
MTDNPLNYIEKISRTEVYKNLMHEMRKTHLRLMIETIAKKPETTYNLEETPLSGVSPADLCEILEDLTWHESDILIDRHWSDITFCSHEWGFELHLSFSGFEWVAHLYRGEEL